MVKLNYDDLTLTTNKNVVTFWSKMTPYLNSHGYNELILEVMSNS